jgi:hypothetical protein
MASYDLTSSYLKTSVNYITQQFLNKYAMRILQHYARVQTGSVFLLNSFQFKVERVKTFTFVSR